MQLLVSVPKEEKLSLFDVIPMKEGVTITVAKTGNDLFNYKFLSINISASTFADLQNIYEILKLHNFPINTNILPPLKEIGKTHFLWKEMKERLTQVFYLECFSDISNREANLILLEEMSNIEKEEAEEMDICTGLILARL